MHQNGKSLTMFSLILYNFETTEFKKGVLKKSSMRNKFYENSLLSVQEFSSAVYTGKAKIYFCSSTF